MEMKRFLVTLNHIIGYDSDKEPVLKRTEFELKAKNESDAREKAKNFDTTTLTVWEYWAEELTESEARKNRS